MQKKKEGVHRIRLRDSTQHSSPCTHGSGWRGQEWSEAGGEQGVGPDAAGGGASAWLATRFHLRSTGICSQEPGVPGRRGGEGGRQVSCPPLPGESDTTPNTGVRHMEMTVWELSSHSAHRLPFSTRTLAPRSLEGRGRFQDAEAYLSAFSQMRGREGSRRSPVGPNCPLLRMRSGFHGEAHTGSAPTSSPHLAGVEKIFF